MEGHASLLEPSPSQERTTRALHTAGALAAATVVVVLLSWNSGAPNDAVALTQQANGQLLLASGMMLSGEADPYDAMAAQANSSPYSDVAEAHHHWGGVGSEGYGTKEWDNTGWNAHYHPRDGASMDSESMEPWYWRKGPGVNDEYTGHAADGDPLFSPPDGWEPPIRWGKE